MGRHKGSQNKTRYRLPPTGHLSLDDKLKLIAGIIVDRIIADMSGADTEAQSNA